MQKVWALVWTARAGNLIKSTGDAQSDKVVDVRIMRIAVLIVLYQLVAAYRDVIQVVKEGFAGTGFQRNIPFWVDYILHSKAKRYGYLHIAVCLRFILFARNAKESQAPKKIGGKPKHPAVVAPVHEMVLGSQRRF